MRLRKITLGSAMVLVFILAFPRCSPINRSLDKSALKYATDSPSSPQNLSITNPVSTTSNPTPSPSPSDTPVFVYKFQVVSSDQVRENTCAGGKSAITVKLSAKDLPKQFGELKKEGITSLPIEGAATDMGSTTFRVNLSRDEIEADQLARFNSVLKPADDKHWILAVLKSDSDSDSDVTASNDQVAQDVRDSLSEIQICLHKADAIPASGASPSPAPTHR